MPEAMKLTIGHIGISSFKVLEHVEIFAHRGIYPRDVTHKLDKGAVLAARGRLFPGLGCAERVILGLLDVGGYRTGCTNGATALPWSWRLS